MSQQSGIGIAFVGSGSAVPSIALDNAGMSQVVDTSDEWIASRTGIRQRWLSGRPRKTLWRWQEYPPLTWI
jgi:3-oxoacyl-[acyl-carrier-protein] synthase III